jgi:hypothetical protein
MRKVSNVMVRSTCSNRRLRTAIAALAGILAWPVVASAQLDPLLMLKRTQPNVLLVVETTNRMNKDADSNYYDPNTYTKTGALWEGSLSLNVVNSTTQYRRKYMNLVNVDTGSGSDKFSADTIIPIGDQDPAYAKFWGYTRLSVARLSARQAVIDNQTVARFGLIKTRQSNPTWGTEKNEGPVSISTLEPTEDAPGKWKITRPTVGARNGSITPVQTPLVVPGAANANTTVIDTLNKSVGTAGALVPAGQDAKNVVDSPLEFMLDDAKKAAEDLIDADTECRNTVVVLLVGGGEGQTVSGANPATKASAFLNVRNLRVPIYVIAIAPPAGDVSQLQAIAANSGGQYFEITKTVIDAVAAGTPVPEVTRAVNIAVQHAFAEIADFNPAAQNPIAPTKSEFQVTSPVMGTVDLKDSKYIDGTTITDGEITSPTSTVVIPQRSNVLLTTGFTLPEFGGALHAFRVYKPVVDNTKPSGYKFVSDGRRLWDASAPAAASRNIYTVTPNGTMTALTSANATVLAPYMNTTTADAAKIIDYVRALPLGPFIGSTPAIMDAPSVDPPPDPEYPGFADANKNRRTIIWIGGNNGMMHGIDGRLGVEVWAFVPFNLLPKLRTLMDGQAVGNFDYLVDSSAKVADVRVSSPCSGSSTSCWRTYMFFGEGPGGTFYQTFDVTMADMASVVDPEDNAVSNVLGYFADPGRLTFKWAFPDYQNFDYTLAPYGDIKATAPNVEKTVGETWSDPAVGEIQNQNGAYAVITGSGFLSYSKQTAANRGGIVAGSTFYLLNVETGAVYDSRDVGNDSKAETVDNCADANPKNCEEIKNALQADPVATGPPDSRYITKTYIGDLDGRVWRFDLGMVNGLPKITAAPTKLYDAGANHPLFASMAAVNVGSTRQYIFFATGSDLLPTDNLGVLKAPFKLLGVLDSGGSGSKTFELALTRLANRTSEEKPTAFPAVAGDIVFFTTTTYHPATPCTLPDANLYAVTFIGGPAYDNTGDDRITGSDTAKVKTVTGARATAPFIADQHFVFSAGGKVELFGDKEDYNNGVGQVGVRTLSWREVR